MGIKGEAPQTAIATLINGKATAVFNSRPYTRMVVTVDMQNTVAGPVTLYRGSLSGAFSRIAGSPQGSNQQYTQPFRLPAGQGMFVVWDSLPTPVSGASAKITWMVNA